MMHTSGIFRVAADAKRHKALHYAVLHDFGRFFLPLRRATRNSSHAATNKMLRNNTLHTFHRLIALLALSVLADASALHAADGPRTSALRLMHRVDSVLSKRQMDGNASLDTAYVTMPSERLRLQLNAEFSGINVTTTSPADSSRTSRMEVNSGLRASMSIGISYRDLSVGFTVVPAGVLGQGDTDMEFSIANYGNRLGFSLLYRTTDTFEGSAYQLDKEPSTDVGAAILSALMPGLNPSGSDSASAIKLNEMEIPRGLLTQRLAQVDGYYVFNHRRFSYPAAFNVSRIQHKTAGSLLLGASLLDNRLNIDWQTQVNDTALSLSNRTRLFHVAIGAGYGRNIVTRHKWLLHYSIIPELIVYAKSRSNWTVSDGIQTVQQSSSMKYQFPRFITVMRLSAIKFHKQFYYGVTANVRNSDVGNATSLQISNTWWQSQLLCGMRLSFHN
ncbi:MAG: DUF4421 domain-containing protein [Bacteroidales bacterium]|nr:DUF4421 domain-containing protein [Bacteroidales bacterium]